MRWNKILMLYLFLVMAFCMACTRAVDKNSTIQINIPQSFNSQAHGEFLYSQPISMNAVTTQGNDGPPAWNTTLDPSPLTLISSPTNPINCYGVMISGPESSLQSSQCSTMASGVPGNFYTGVIALGIYSGAIISATVPAGTQRQILVIGAHANTVAACDSFRTGQLDTANLSEVFVLGSVTQDLPAGNVSVNIPVTLSGSSPKIVDCQGPAFDLNQGSFLNFGGAVSGTNDYTVTSNTDDIESLTNSGPSYLKSVHQRITGFSVDPATTPTMTKLSVNNGNVFSNGDEVMVIVMENNNGAPPPSMLFPNTPIPANTNNYGACGYNAFPGMFGFATVVTTPTTMEVDISKGTFVDKMTQGLVTTDQALLTSYMNVAMSPSLVAPSCFIQLVKVSHFHNLTINDGASLSAVPFSFTSGNVGGGVLAIRVESNLMIGNNAQISADGAGYFTPSGSGAGIGGMGASTCPSAQPNMSSAMSGGSCWSNSGTTLGAGGAYASFAGGSGKDPSAALIPGGMSMTNSNNSNQGPLDWQMLMGGAGGNGYLHSSPPPSVNYGAGGGIVYISARNIQGPPSIAGTISSNGSPGFGYSTDSGDAGSSTSAGGGGAGGSVYVAYQSATSTVGLLNITAKGGNGAGDSTSTYVGGGGSGGQIQVSTCGSTPLTSSLFQTAGTGATAAQSGTPVLKTVLCNN